jgi:hypothetical protein
LVVVLLAGLALMVVTWLAWQSILNLLWCQVFKSFFGSMPFLWFWPAAAKPQNLTFCCVSALPKVCGHKQEKHKILLKGLGHNFWPGRLVFRLPRFGGFPALFLLEGAADKRQTI